MFLDMFQYISIFNHILDITEKRSLRVASLYCFTLHMRFSRYGLRFHGIMSIFQAVLTAVSFYNDESRHNPARKYQASFL